MNMARNTRAKSSASFRRTQKKAPDPAQPLHHSRQETFAKVFASTLDLDRAIQSAGYKPLSPTRAGGRLLQIPAIQNRIRHLQGADAEALDSVKLIQNLHFDRKMVLAKAISVNPFSGKVTFDFARLTAGELAGFEFKISAKDGNFGAGAAVEVQSNSASTLSTLAHVVSHPDYAPRQKQDNSFFALLREIGQRNNNAAPIRAEFENDDD